MPPTIRSLAMPLLAALLATTQDRAQELDLKVLYAGVPSHARTAAWRGFLAHHTRGVTVVDAEQLAPDVVGDADVVVLDCPDPIVRDAEGKPTRIAVPHPKQLAADFGRPTIVVGAMALVTDRLQLKSNWL